jgi:hypothetical protein
VTTYWNGSTPNQKRRSQQRSAAQARRILFPARNR